MPNPNLPIGGQYNVYNGARYVPLIMDEWSATVNYEPLMIVTSEGNSYTSKTFVPAGTPVSNTTYWAKTGDYNAQVAQYRKEVENLSKNPVLRPKKYLFCADWAYAQTYNENVTAIDKAIKLLNLTAEQYVTLVSPNYGVSSSIPTNTYDYLINQLTFEPTDVIILTGNSFTISDYTNLIVDMRSMWPTVNIKFFGSIRTPYTPQNAAVFNASDLFNPIGFQEVNNVLYLSEYGSDLVAQFIINTINNLTQYKWSFTFNAENNGRLNTVNVNGMWAIGATFENIDLGGKSWKSIMTIPALALGRSLFSYGSIVDESGSIASLGRISITGSGTVNIYSNIQLTAASKFIPFY